MCATHDPDVNARDVLKVTVRRRPEETRSAHKFEITELLVVPFAEAGAPVEMLQMQYNTMRKMSRN